MNMIISHLQLQTETAMAQPNIQVSSVWPVEKYARFVSSSAPATGGEGRKEGIWQVTGMTDAVLKTIVMLL